MQVLVVEDDFSIAASISHLLQSLGARVDVQKTLSVADFSSGRWAAYSLVILDRMLGQNDSLELLPSIRRELPQLGILIVSAIGTAEEKASALEAGADDYLAKPYDAQELQARVRAITRRTMSRERIEVKFSDLNLHRLEKICRYNSKNTLLTAKEFDLLFCLIETPGRVWSKHDLLAKVWGQVAAVESKTVEVTIKNIRKKLLDVESKVKILNERHHGYWVET